MNSKNPRSPLSTEPYKGVRDFYPSDMQAQKHIFSVMSATAESFGFEQYSASILEPAELYEHKTSEEIVKEETYTFTDRGDRRVTLRPEMTPSVSRMVARKQKEFSFPLRWYSIPNLFRYERPQKGRMREHWQLNCDIFGAGRGIADIEILLLAHSLMRAFGAKDEDFSIRINHRGLSNILFEDILSLSEEDTRTLSRLIDKKEKMDKEAFAGELKNLLGDKAEALITLLNAPSLDAFLAHSPLFKESEPARELQEIIQGLHELGIKNAVFSPTIMRGFDYYSGMVFEVFDTHPENNRSLFGGGRYDNLLDLFGVPPTDAVGFGMGDVTILEFLDSRKLMPEQSSSVDLFIATFSREDTVCAQKLARTLREEGLAVLVNATERKIGDQIRFADKKHIPFVLALGERERETGEYTVKHLESGTENKTNADGILDVIFSPIEE